jgi:hypothetical protein
MVRVRGTRIKAVLVYFEIISIILILTLYSSHAFIWSNTGEIISLAFGNSDVPSILGYVIGGIFWLIAYIAILTGSIYLRCNYCNSRREFAVIAVMHIAYHAIRWPIFAAMIVSAVTTKSGSVLASDYVRESIIVNQYIVTSAMWLDSIVIGSIIASFTVVYTTFYFCSDPRERL